jgi:hypothetical protein
MTKPSSYDLPECQQERSVATAALLRSSIEQLTNILDMLPDTGVCHNPHARQSVRKLRRQIEALLEDNS